MCTDSTATGSSIVQKRMVTGESKSNDDDIVECLFFRKCLCVCVVCVRLQSVCVCVLVCELRSADEGTVRCHTRTNGRNHLCDTH